SDRRLPGQRDKIATLESRRLSGRGPWPLQRLSFTAKRAWRGDIERLSRGRLLGGLGSAAADCAFAGTDPLGRGATLHLLAHRRMPVPRRRRRADGADRERPHIIAG